MANTEASYDHPTASTDTRTVKHARNVMFWSWSIIAVSSLNLPLKNLKIMEMEIEENKIYILWLFAGAVLLFQFFNYAALMYFDFKKIKKEHGKANKSFDAKIEDLGRLKYDGDKDYSFFRPEEKKTIDADVSLFNWWLRRFILIDGLLPAGSFLFAMVVILIQLTMSLSTSA